jgi:hypothetical protein
MNQLIEHYLASFAEKLADAPGGAHLAERPRRRRPFLTQIWPLYRPR